LTKRKIKDQCSESLQSQEKNPEKYSKGNRYEFGCFSDVFISSKMKNAPNK